MAEVGPILSSRARNDARSSAERRATEACPVAVSSYRNWQWLEPGAGQPVEEVKRQPGEPGALSHREQPGRAGPENGRDAPSGVAEQTFQHAVEAGPVGVRRCRENARRPGAVEVNPGACGEIGGGRAGVEQGMALAGHDAGGQVEEAVAPQEGGQRVAGVEAGFVFASRFTGDSCVAIFERAFDRLRATGIAELVRHAEFLEALDDYDIVLTAPPGRAE